MDIRYMKYVPHAGGYLAVTNYQSADSTLNFYPDASCNGYDFFPQSLEIDTRSNIFPIVVYLDTLAVDINPNCYYVLDIRGINVVSISSTETISANWYSYAKPETRQNIARQEYPITKVTYNQYGLYGTPLTVQFYTAGNVWKWVNTNPAPFNVVQDITIPIKVLNADNVRKHIAFMSVPFISKVGAVNAQWDSALRYNSDGSNNYAILSPGEWYFDAPLFIGELWIAFNQFDFHFPGGGTAGNGSQATFGYVVVETYGN